MKEKHYTKRIYVEDVNEINSNEIIFDGFGFVLLTGMVRIDIGKEVFKEERELF